MFGFRKEIAALREENQALRESLIRLEAALGAELPLIRERLSKLEAAQAPEPEDAERAKLAAEQGMRMQEGIANILGYSLETMRKSKGVLTDG